MKKISVFFASILVSYSAYAVSPNDKELMIRNNTNTGNLLLFAPDTGVYSIVGWDPNSTSGRTDGGVGSYTTMNISSGLVYDPVLTTVGVTPNLAEYNAFSLPNSNLLMRDGSGILTGTTITAIGQAVMSSANTAAMKSTIFTGSSSDVVLDNGGATALNTSNVPEVSNLYFTNARSVSALTGQNISIFNNDSAYLQSSALIPYLTSALAATTYQPVFSSQSANTFYAGPTASSGSPTFRSIAAADVPTLNQNTTGNSSTATKIATARNIAGVSFDGSANISLTSGSAIQKANGTGGFTSATAGTDYQSPLVLTTTGTGAATLAGNTLNIPTYAPTSRTFNQTTPTLNGTGTQLSTTQDTLVSCAVDITVQSLLLGNASGAVSLRYADNAAMTTNVVTVISGQSVTGGVLSLTNTNTATLTGVIPSGKFRQITSAVTSGTATFANTKCQEVTQ